MQAEISPAIASEDKRDALIEWLRQLTSDCD